MRVFHDVGDLIHVIQHGLALARLVFARVDVTQLVTVQILTFCLLGKLEQIVNIFGGYIHVGHASFADKTERCKNEITYKCN